MSIIIANKSLGYISVKNRIISMDFDQIIPIFYLIGILILVLPSFIKTNLVKKQFFNNLSIWLIIILTVISITYFFLR